MNVFDPKFKESLREYGSNDGAVVIRMDGVAHSAGTYLTVSTENIEARGHWGARHRSAAAITTVSNAASVVVSETSGVTIMWRGKPILELAPGE